MNLARHVATLTAFADSYLTGKEEHDYLIRLKREHSLRVLENGRGIVEGEGISGRTAELTILASLYHDIGRFPQLARYGTFKDADSVNHGHLGAQTMREVKLPAGVTPEEWKLIRAAVGMHNAKIVDPSINGILRTMVDVVRDADKIDIYAVILDHFSATDNSREKIIHSLEDHPTCYSTHVYETIFSGSTCDYDSLRYSNDFILLLIGWAFSLSFPTSLSMLSERNLVKKAFSLLPDDDKIKALEEKTRAFIIKNAPPLDRADLRT